LALSTAALVRRVILAPDNAVRGDRRAAKVASLSGVIFILAGLAKFAFFAWEVRAFRTFGLPWPSALVIVAGLAEAGGGVLLCLRLAVAPTASLLAVTMLVAIGTSGVGHGDIVPSLTVAPALLAAMVFLLARAQHAAGRPRRTAVQPSP